MRFAVLSIARSATWFRSFRSPETMRASLPRLPGTRRFLDCILSVLKVLLLGMANRLDFSRCTPAIREAPQPANSTALNGQDVWHPLRSSVTVKRPSRAIVACVTVVQRKDVCSNGQRPFTSAQPRHLSSTIKSNDLFRPRHHRHGGVRQSCSTTLKREVLISIPPLYLMKPNFLNLFMKKLTRERVVPTICASVSCETLGSSPCGWSSLP